MIMKVRLVALLAVCFTFLYSNAANVVRLTHAGGSTEYSDLKTCIHAMSSATPVDGKLTITFLDNIQYAFTESDAALEQWGYTVGVNLSSISGLNRVVVDGNGKTLSSTSPTDHYNVANMKSIVFRMNTGGVVEVKNLTITDNICFKPWNTKSSDATGAQADLYIHDCIITGHYTTQNVPFRKATFERNHFTVGKNCVIWPKITNNTGGLDHKGLFPYKLVLKDNYAITDGLVNTASTNYSITSHPDRVKVDLEVTGNTIQLPVGTTQVCLIQNTDCFGDVNITGNKILGKFTDDGLKTFCILMFYGHTNFWKQPDRFGKTDYIYDSSSKIIVKDNLAQCGLMPFAIGGEDGVASTHKGAQRDYRNIPADEKALFPPTTLTGNETVHHFPAETFGHSAVGHVCEVCGTAIVTADHDGIIKCGGVDVNTIENNTVYSWNEISTQTPAPYNYIDVSTANTPKGKLLAKGEKAAFSYDNAPTGGNGVKRVATATLLGSTLTSGAEWTNPGNLTQCPVINATPQVKLVIPEHGYTTFSSDEDVDFENAVYTDNSSAAGKFKGYRATKYNYQSEEVSQLYYTSTAALPKTEGALVNGEAGTYWLPILDSCPIFSSDNGMKVGNCHLAAGNDNIFVLASSPDNPLGLYRLGVDVDVPFGYSYLDLSGITVTSGSGSGSKAYRLSFVLVDDVTGIEEVVDCHTNGRGTAAYNIGGGQVGNSYRGIVIRNGVKYLNK